MIKIKRIALAVVIAGAVVTAFLYGVGVGNFQWPPYKLLKSVKSGQIFERPVAYEAKDGELLQFAFENPIIESELLYDPIFSIEGVYEANLACVLPTEYFFDAYQQMDLEKDETFFLDGHATKIRKITYSLADNQYNSYAYKIDGETNNNTAVLIIPGSGHNQSSAIYRNDPNNYHYGIIDLFKERGVNIYIYLKPNNDILAFHNGYKKINDSFYINWHLNKGSSYSAHYIANSLAFSKYLNDNYLKTIVAGLSQGGYAAFLNAVQSEPSMAIIASGYSILNKKVEWAGHGQIIIPGIKEKLAPNNVNSTIASQRTHYMFSYGHKEIGTYRLDAEEQMTCSHFNSLENVACIIHDQGHVFPINEIEAFLKTNLNEN